MVVSHLTGRGAAELVRLWGEPPLVREPDLALFGVDRLEPAEQEALSRSPLRCYLAVDIHRYGAGITAQGAVDRIHGKGSEFVLHLDVDVIADFQSTNYPGSGGLVFEEVREALNIFAKQKHLAAIEVTAYNPAKDSDRRGAQMIIDLLADALEARLSASQEEPRPSVAVAVGASSVPPDTELAQQSTTDTVIEPGAGKLGEGAELVTPLESAQNPESTKDEPAS
jgi:arginase family enzyme